MTEQPEEVQKLNDLFGSSERDSNSSWVQPGAWGFHPMRLVLSSQSIFFFFSWFFFWSFIEVELIYKAVIICAVQQSDPVIHIHIIHSLWFFSHIDYHRILGRVPCAIQQVPVGQSFHIPQCAYANPKPLVRPSHTPFPFGGHKFFKVMILNYIIFKSQRNKEVHWERNTTDLFSLASVLNAYPKSLCKTDPCGLYKPSDSLSVGQSIWDHIVSLGWKITGMTIHLPCEHMFDVAG